MIGMPIANTIFYSPVHRAWLILLIFWPLSDALRKWGGLNQPGYAIQMLVPFIIGYFLWRQNALRIDRSIAAPALLLTISTGILALYYSVFEYSISYLAVWIFSLSALIGPILLLCVRADALSVNSTSVTKHTSLLVIITSLLFLTNNILTIIQSVLGRNHFLSAAVGGVLDAQIATNTEIELRSPGIFAFVLGSANFSAICIIFLLSSFAVSLPKHTGIIRFLSLLTFPLAVVRTISRTFLFLILTVCLPWVRLLLRPKVLVGVMVLGTISAVIAVFSPYIVEIFNHGLTNFDQRIEDADGLTDGILIRFLSSFYLHEGGGKVSLFFNLPSWFRSNSLSMLFGYGLGFAGPLFRFSQKMDPISYGHIYIEGVDFLLGETFYSSLLAEIGVMNMVIYFWLVINSVRFFLRSFPLYPFLLSRSYVHASFIAYVLALVNPTTPYFRPLSVLFLTASVLNPYVCKSLFDPSMKFRPQA